jgi:DNA-binding transcriptional LysR family regulator
MPDWDDFRYFLAVARNRSLSAASRELRVTQSTVGRRLDGLETRLGVRLLKRTPNGYVLTPAGMRVLENAERIESETHALERQVTGFDTRLGGSVRVTTIETFGAAILAPLFAELQQRLPAVSVELVTDSRTLSLFKRDADIAVRLARPEQYDLIAKRIGNVGFAVYASKGYLRDHGNPDFTTGCDEHKIITLHEDLLSFPDARWLAKLTSKAKLAFVSNSRYVHVEAALAGIGLACLPSYLADRHAELVRLETPSRAPMREIWLAVHRDTRRTPRIRAVFDAITAGVKARASMLNPNDAAVHGCRAVASGTKRDLKRQ